MALPRPGCLRRRLPVPAHLSLDGEDWTVYWLLPTEWDVTADLRPGEENRLLVVVERAPALQGQIGWTSRERRWKSRFAYGWDWCARLVPVGIWDSVSLRAWQGARFRTVTLHTNL